MVSIERVVLPACTNRIAMTSAAASEGAQASSLVVDRVG